jgi:arylsulfatase A-like enzyme
MERIRKRGVEASDGDLKLYSMIENIDENVGDLMDRLETLELRDQTVVIFATDQGVSDRGAPMPRSKGKQRPSHPVAYDEKHAVTCMMRYPPLTKAGRHEALTGMVDLAPTILDLCGVPRPSSIDGRSLRPLLGGDTQWMDDRTLVVQCPRSRVRKQWDNAAVKTQRWRLVGEVPSNRAIRSWGSVSTSPISIACHSGIGTRVASSNEKMPKFWNTRIREQSAGASRNQFVVVR